MPKWKKGWAVQFEGFEFAARLKAYAAARTPIDAIRDLNQSNQSTSLFTKLPKDVILMIVEELIELEYEMNTPHWNSMENCSSRSCLNTDELAHSSPLRNSAFKKLDELRNLEGDSELDLEFVNQLDTQRDKMLAIDKKLHYQRLMLFASGVEELKVECDKWLWDDTHESRLEQRHVKIYPLIRYAKHYLHASNDPQAREDYHSFGNERNHLYSLDIEGYLFVSSPLTSLNHVHISWPFRDNSDFGSCSPIQDGERQTLAEAMRLLKLQLKINPSGSNDEDTLQGLEDVETVQTDGRNNQERFNIEPKYMIFDQEWT
ncbi:uncharacterized protein KY384_002242 [Bacidia gigantensis]|uniref:uncharacterized protein n=1 Tax=Bacidia gigantensis TaxID=2732470 RepID=UPI001D04E98F|nr:uncharacterized protein KY384_002242 [Bacidia gigantensis]KAG8533459.1 hypothetical protein KY384_002242 [Bacidia gigantensis]